MRRPLWLALSILLGCLAMGARPILADCVSCGTGGECFVASPGFSANCACITRVLHGSVICKPSGICDPTDPNTCKDDGGFPQGIVAHTKISTRFLEDLAEANPLLAGAVWAGISEANSALKNDRAEVKGTMGNRKGKSYTYVTKVRLLSDGSASIAIHVDEDGSGRGMDFEGTVEANGRSGQFAQIGPKGRSSVYSWDAD